MQDFVRTEDPSDLDLDPDVLDQAYDLLASWTQDGDPPLPAAGLSVGRGSRILKTRLFGRMGPETDAEPIHEDARFLTASLTKPIVYLAVLQLVERGKLRLSDRVVDYLPRFSANGKEDVRILHLLTHTSGLPDQLPNNLELRRKHAPMARFLKGTCSTELLFPPGTSVRYQSMGTLVAATILEQVTGRSLGEILRKDVFEPLGMSRTSLGTDGLDDAWILRNETPGGSETSDWDWNSEYWRHFGAPWGGVFGVPADYARLCSFLVTGGEAGPARLLGPRTIAAMTTAQTDRLPGLSDAVRRSDPWGLGWRLNAPIGSSDAFCDLLGPQVFGHYGATGTMAWMDPETGLFCVLFTTGIRMRASWRFQAVSNIVAASLR